VIGIENTIMVYAQLWQRAGLVFDSATSYCYYRKKKHKTFMKKKEKTEIETQKAER